MALVNATNYSTNGRCYSFEEASVKISPCASSQQALSTFCLLGKVVAPMVINEATIIDFVEKVWKFNVTVVALNDGANNHNCFELGFLSTENRSWALERGPWCIRGYTFILKAWAPKKEHFDMFENVRIWLHIFNLPRDYFSIDNGKILGTKAGSVIKVDLDKGNPALWSKSLRVLINLNVNLPLFSGCYFDLESGIQRWVQFKYERLGIFCYNCGKLGHQRRGCHLASPVTVSSLKGVPFPLFGPWLSMDSSYLDVFSGAKSFNPASSSSAQVASGSVRGGSRPLALVSGAKGAVRRTPVSRLASRTVMAAGRSSLGEGKARYKMWVPKAGSASCMPEFAITGNMASGRTLRDGKSTEMLPFINSKSVDLRKMSGKEKDFLKGAIGPAFSSIGTGSKVDHFRDGAFSGGPINRCNESILALNGAEPTMENQKSPLPLLKAQRPCITYGPGGLPDFKNNINFASCETPNKTISIESSTCGQEVNFHNDETLALSYFFQAQETLLHDLKKFGNLDLYEIKTIGGDIGVPTPSEVNERTTPFKKRKFDGASASLCSRPWKIPRHHPGVVRDFPWDSDVKAIATNDVEEEPTEDASLSNSDFLGSDEWCSKGKNVISARPMVVRTAYSS
ncbi:hypothetical protein F8388_002163 [Cannabis sativa]|uniref:CCHC-type domain-containing protein n=1 Tax=Cannabis sativa TaxID=3483 RepID=A0A7J6EYW8_CANSA|nr:hypothetical protein F8388_002163 [Cannabis sativa]KAF4389910.1 hypothetical protein G4B88_024191 [Cannabis sativa]